MARSDALLLWGFYPHNLSMGNLFLARLCYQDILKKAITTSSNWLTQIDFLHLNKLAAFWILSEVGEEWD
jgi:hypothetical protein